MLKEKVEASVEQIDFCKTNRRQFSLVEGVLQQMYAFPRTIRNTRCSINPNQPYGYEQEPFLIDFKEVAEGTKRVVYWRFQIRQRALYCNGAKGEWEKIEDVVFSEDVGRQPNPRDGGSTEQTSKKIRIAQDAFTGSTPTSKRVASSQVFGITEDPEISGKQWEAKIRARIDALGSSISTTTVKALTSFSNSFEVKKGTILSKDQLPSEFFGSHSGMNDYTYFEIVDFKTTSEGSTWDGNSFEVPISNIRVQTTVMTVKPSEAGRDGTPNFANLSRSQALDKVSSSLRDSVSSSITAPSFVRDVSGSKSKTESSDTASRTE